MTKYVIVVISGLAFGLMLGEVYQRQQNKQQSKIIKIDLPERPIQKVARAKKVKPVSPVKIEAAVIVKHEKVQEIVREQVIEQEEIESLVTTKETPAVKRIHKPLTKSDVLSIKRGKFYLDGKPFAEISFNKFDLFYQLHYQVEDGEELNDENPMVKRQDKALRELSEMGFRTIRFFGLPWGPDGPDGFEDPDGKKQIYTALDKALELCDKNDIRAIVTIACGDFTDRKRSPVKGTRWEFGEEHLRELVQDRNSRGRERLYTYIDEYVGRYKNHRAVTMWEISNEMTLKIDIGGNKDPEKRLSNDGERLPTLEDLGVFYNDVAKRIKKVDPLRIVNNGGGHLRSSAWNSYQGNGWQKDTYKEHTKAFKLLFKNSAVDVMDVHLYPNHHPSYYLSNGRGGKEALETKDYMKLASYVKMPLIVGEFGLQPAKSDSKVWDEEPDYFETNKDVAAATPWFERDLNNIIDAGVQLSYWWTYSSDREMDAKNPQTFNISRDDDPELVALIVDANRRLKKKLRIKQ